VVLDQAKCQHAQSPQVGPGALERHTGPSPPRPRHPFHSPHRPLLTTRSNTIYSVRSHSVPPSPEITHRPPCSIPPPMHLDSRPPRSSASSAAHPSAPVIRSSTSPIKSQDGHCTLMQNPELATLETQNLVFKRNSQDGHPPRARFGHLAPLSPNAVRERSRVATSPTCTL